jgi:hypothetical protein
LTCHHSCLLKFANHFANYRIATFWNELMFPGGQVSVQCVEGSTCKEFRVVHVRNLCQGVDSFHQSHALMKAEISQRVISKP